MIKVPVFKIETNGKEFRILIKKGKVWVEEEELRLVHGCGLMGWMSYFSSRRNAVRFIRERFGEKAEIIREWRPA